MVAIHLWAWFICLRQGLFPGIHHLFPNSCGPWYKRLETLDMSLSHPSKTEQSHVKVHTAVRQHYFVSKVALAALLWQLKGEAETRQWNKGTQWSEPKYFSLQSQSVHTTRIPYTKSKDRQNHSMVIEVKIVKIAVLRRWGQGKVGRLVFDHKVDEKMSQSARKFCILI